MIQKLHEEVRLKIEKNNAKYVEQANRCRKYVEFEVGELVWVHLRKDRFPPGKFEKLKPRIDGPFKIIEKIGENAYKLQLPDEYEISPMFNVKELRAYHGEDLRASLFSQLWGIDAGASIRRHAFIVWLVIHDRLDTHDKLLKWGLINSMSCVFCRANVEDRNHLFFGCHFTADIWMRVLRLCGNFRMPRNWENEFLWVMGAKGKSFISIIKRIAWGATIYHLWRHRNSRIHETDYSFEETIFHLICNDVRLKVSGL